MKVNRISLLWLRRDLRLHDHAALAAALENPAPVQPVFVFDSEILAPFSAPDDRRLTFIAQALCELDRTLQKRGGGLLVLHGRARTLIPQLFSALEAGQVFAARDFEPQTMARDEAVAASLGGMLSLAKDHLIFSPEEVLKDDGSMYKVFTPYSKAWLARLTPLAYAAYPHKDQGRYADISAARQRARQAGLTVLDPAQGAGAMLEAIGYRPVALDDWPVSGAQEMLERFIAQKAAGYKVSRDVMSLPGTSRLSPYLRFGLVSIREALRAALDHGNAQTWINELIWREFYAAVLYHTPESQHDSYNPLYRGLRWPGNAEHFSAWQQGRTGYPVVDAAMRQLLQTGWMHNRARMIVASFLTKDLLLDWRLGEAHFAQYLMDYELSSNVGGWQWAASTGTDAQPWFRIFNPTLQSERFDPQGEYIRRYVPELKGLSDKDIHMPPAVKRPRDYPAPIVDHKDARENALAMFRQHAAKAGEHE